MRTGLDGDEYAKELLRYVIDKSGALEASALHYSTKNLRNGSPHPYELTSSS